MLVASDFLSSALTPAPLWRLHPCKRQSEICHILWIAYTSMTVWVVDFFQVLFVVILANARIQ